MPTTLFRFCTFALVCLELALILVVVDRFDLESKNHFFEVLCLAVGGFVIHAWLPRRMRARLFTLLSLAGIVYVLGWTNGAYVIGIGGGLIALCHVPAPLVFRVPLLVVAGILLAALRVQYPEPFWPVLGSMFMFRLIVYLFEVRQARDRAPLGHTLAYFFPLPNVCFLLFPVLDFKTFRETYYDDDDYTVYQSGIAWIVRGISHLLVYRWIKYYVLPSPHELRDGPHLALFLAANYGLYLHVSGWFHVITGLLHLFGFNLPRTHQNYFLASSFTDVWRRINIYWKDFMTKVFFFPAFFKLRRRSVPGAMGLAVLWVFVATWLLHSYQLFWLVGELPLAGKDAVLWLSVGLLAAGNLMLDVRRAAGREGVRKQVVTAEYSVPSTQHRVHTAEYTLPSTEHAVTNTQGPGRGVEHAAAGTQYSAPSTQYSVLRTRCFAPILSYLLISLRTLGMFALVSIFWAFWTIPNFRSYLNLPRRWDRVSAGGLMLVIVLVGLVALGVLVQWGRERLLRWGMLPVSMSFRRSVAVHAVALGLLVLAAIPQVAGQFGTSAEKMIATLRLDSYTPAEAGQVVLGYYDEITQTHVQAGPFLGGPSTSERLRAVGVEYTELTQPTDDLLERELIPGWSGKAAGSPLSINQLGMRDRQDITQRKSANTCRIALVGSSVVMGYGVADDQVFKVLLGDRLNAVRAENGPRFELLNFGTGMSWVIHRRVLIERRVYAFEPDAIYYFAHQDELLGPVRHLAKLVARRDELPYPCLVDVVRQAGIKSGMSWGAVEARLQPFGQEIVVGMYRDLVDDCRRRSILPVWVYLPMPGIVDVPVKSSDLVSAAEEAGFVVVNMANWSEGYAPADVKLSEHDLHANALGHRVIADRLFEAMRERPELLPAFARWKRGGGTP
jgi:hypothetical protein